MTIFGTATVLASPRATDLATLTACLGDSAALADVSTGLKNDINTDERQLKQGDPHPGVGINGVHASKDCKNVAQDEQKNIKAKENLKRRSVSRIGPLTEPIQPHALLNLSYYDWNRTIRTFSQFFVRTCVEARPTEGATTVGRLSSVIGVLATCRSTNE